MRLERIDAGDVTVLNDAYNANPASMAAAAEVLAESDGRRKVMVLGDMLELGDQAEALHTRMGGRIAAAGADLLITVGPLGRYIAEGGKQGGAATQCFDSIADAKRDLVGLLRPGDVVLLKASRAVGLECLVEPIRAAFAKRRRKSKK